MKHSCPSWWSMRKDRQHVARDLTLSYVKELQTILDCHAIKYDRLNDFKKHRQSGNHSLNLERYSEDSEHNPLTFREVISPIALPEQNIGRNEISVGIPTASTDETKNISFESSHVSDQGGVVVQTRLGALETLVTETFDKHAKLIASLEDFDKSMLAHLKVLEDTSKNESGRHTNEADCLPVKLIRPEAQLPTRSSDNAAGFILYAAETLSVPAGGRAVVKIGICIAAPVGTYARIAPSFRLAFKFQIGVGAGVVDADYRGEVGVVLFNHGSSSFDIFVGDAVAQLLLEKISNAKCVEVHDLMR